MKFDKKFRDEFIEILKRSSYGNLVIESEIYDNDKYFYYGFSFNENLFSVEGYEHILTLQVFENDNNYLKKQISDFVNNKILIKFNLNNGFDINVLCYVWSSDNYNDILDCLQSRYGEENIFNVDKTQKLTKKIM